MHFGEPWSQVIDGEAFFGNDRYILLHTATTKYDVHNMNRRIDWARKKLDAMGLQREETKKAML